MAVSGPKRTKIEREEALEEVAKLHRRGYSLRAIAKKLGVTFQQVDYDVRVICKRHAKNTMDEHAAYVSEKMEQYKELRVEALEAWERSKLNAEKHVKEVQVVPTEDGMSERTKEVDTEEGQYGDPRFLEVIRNVLADEREMLGLNEPTEMNVNNKMDWSIFVSAQKPTDLAEQRMTSGVPKLEDNTNGTNGKHD